MQYVFYVKTDKWSIVIRVLTSKLDNENRFEMVKENWKKNDLFSSLFPSPSFVISVLYPLSDWPDFEINKFRRRSKAKEWKAKKKPILFFRLDHSVLSSAILLAFSASVKFLVHSLNNLIGSVRFLFNFIFKLRIFYFIIRRFSDQIKPINKLSILLSWNSSDVKL